MPSMQISAVLPARMKAMVRTSVGAACRRLWSAIPKLAYLGRRPSALFIALTRKCNANCVFCAYQFATREQRSHMPPELFDEVIKEIEQRGIQEVMLSPNIGEPTIAPDFLEKIRRLRRAGVTRIEMTTNALYLHKIGIDKLLTDGPDIINISFAGFDKEMYERDFRVKHYERTRDNILDLLRANKKLGKPRIINFRLRGDGSIEELMAKPEMAEVRELANSIGTLTEVDNWLGLIKQEALPSGYKLQSDRPYLTSRPCRLLFDLTVHPDGDIHLCSCRNVSGDPDMHIGNLRDISLQDAHRKIPGVLKKWEQGSPPISCQTCSMYNDPAPAFAGRVQQVWGKALARSARRSNGLMLGRRERARAFRFRFPSLFRARTAN